MSEFYVMTEKDDLNYEKTNKHWLTVSLCDINKYGLAYTEDMIIDRPNGRPDYLIMLIVRGKMEVLIDQKLQPVTVGDIIYIAPYTPQRFVRFYKDKAEHYFVHFIGYAVPEILEDIGLTESGIYHTDRLELLSEAFQKIMIAMVQKKQPMYINSLFLRLLSHLHIERSREAGFATSRVSPAVMQLLWDYKLSKSMNYYASLCNMTLANFSVTFKRELGVSPLKFRENVRLENAKQLLSESCLTVKEVANAVGYEDPYAFSKFFKRNTGISPSQYRLKEAKVEQRGE